VPRLAQKNKRFEAGKAAEGSSIEYAVNNVVNKQSSGLGFRV
jgi:hypothetical protein